MNEGVIRGLRGKKDMGKYPPPPQISDASSMGPMCGLKLMVGSGVAEEGCMFALWVETCGWYTAPFWVVGAGGNCRGEEYVYCVSYDFCVSSGITQDFPSYSSYFLFATT